MPLDLVFGNGDSAGAAMGSDYEKDVFQDVSLLPDDNAGLTDTVSTNPTSAKVGNSDQPRFASKTLLIKDMVLIQDRTRWVNQRPTYQLIFNEAAPGIFAYAFGAYVFEKCASVSAFGGADSPLTRQRILKFPQIGDGVGVTGKIRRLQWILQGSTAAAATAMRATDGSDTTNITFQNVPSASDNNNNAKWGAFSHQSSNETNDLHDFQLKAQQQDTLRVVGVVVYYENSGANLDVAPGRTYVDKLKVETTLGATFAVPTFGSSLGGVIAFSKSASGYSTALQGASPIMTVGVGASGTNLMDVTTGHGASLRVGMGIVAPMGSSHYVGVVRSVSTDTATVFPTLPFGISTAIFSSWSAGPTYPISQTLMAIETTIGRSNMLGGMTNAILDPAGRFIVWGTNIGVTQLLNGQPGWVFKGASGFLAIQGYFQAADIRLEGNGQRFHATIGINGLPCWSENAGVTGAFRRTLFTDGGNGWNSVVIEAGASMGLVQIDAINLFTRQGPVGVSFGLLGLLRVNQSPVNRGAHSATLFGLGMQRRVHADQLLLSGAWSRGVTVSAIGNALYYGTSTNAALDFQWYGRDVAIIGAFTGCTFTVDGAGVPLTSGVAVSLGMGFHTGRLTCGVTTTLQAVDFFSTYDEVQNRQNVLNAAASTDKAMARWKGFTFIGATSADTSYGWVVPQLGQSATIGWVGGCGGGGGGAATSGGGSPGQAAGGGGGSAYPPTPINFAPYVGQVLTIAVGKGGTGTPNGTSPGETGNDSTITAPDGTVLWRAKGGEGGVYTGAGGAGKGLGGTGGAGSNGVGSGATGGRNLFNDVAAPGAGGGDGGGGAGGGGGGAGYTSGAAAGAAGAGAAANATGYGGGGGGGGKTSGGGNASGSGGAPGFVEIYLLLPEYLE